ncbi:hypothetical protein ACN47E_002463 [Coniothyrium glycines]
MISDGVPDVDLSDRGCGCTKVGQIYGRNLGWILARIALDLRRSDKSRDCPAANSQSHEQPESVEKSHGEAHKRSPHSPEIKRGTGRGRSGAQTRPASADPTCGEWTSPARGLQGGNVHTIRN